MPNDWPTHLLPDTFWAELGQPIATFGFLEDHIKRALFALSGTRPIKAGADVSAEVDKWSERLETQLSDVLGSLVPKLYDELNLDNRIDETFKIELISRLRDAKDIRNILCHASWGRPDSNASVLPRFFHKKEGEITSPINIPFLQQTRSETITIICDITDMITQLGYQFPGSRGPCSPVFSK